LTGPKPPGAIAHETPLPARPGGGAFGSDPVAAVLRGLEVPYVALVPGSSFGGLHDSLVNHLGNRAPQIVLALHEENAVAIAHGYAKASGRTMAAALHANVGLMRALMAVYNAWCDRAPVLLLGATGPRDAARRRPWIDWIHTSADQGALVRNITKWDDEPGSVAAALEAVTRAVQIARTAPQGPVYVNLDVTLQEERLAATPPLPDFARYAPPPPVRPSAEAVAAAARLLAGAARPLMLAGRCSRSQAGWDARVALAEALDMPVLSHIKLAAAFPTDHRLHAAPPGASLTPELARLVGDADVVLSLDWLDLAGTLRQAFGEKPAAARVIHVSCDAHSHRGWSLDHQGLAPADVYLLCETDAAVPLLLEALGPRRAGVRSFAQAPPPPAPAHALSMRAVASALEAATRGLDVCYTRFPLGWHGSYAHLRHPLDYLGHDGGGGVGSGPGIAVGAALALQGTGRLPVAVMGDGDFLMGNTAVWTAAHYRIPCLLIVANNGSFYSDERHQARLARQRGRPVENRWIGQRIADPDVDVAGLARALGADAVGPVADPAGLRPAVEAGVAAVRSGRVCVLDVRVPPGCDSRG
jgi:thiamine pyrophosphate-dependent acetolactate synthase large subunit-like protein